MNRLRNRAEHLRAEGYSYSLIRDKLGVSKSTMSYWFRDKPFTPNEKVLARIKNGPTTSGINRHNKRVAEIKKLRELGIKEIGSLSKRDFWLLGLGIYIGEGAKTTESIRISNSDPAIIRLSIVWLKEICSLTNQNFSIRLHLYPDNNIEKSVLYWQKITGLNKQNFRKPSIDNRVDKKVMRSGKLPYGTAHVTVLSLGDPDKGVRLYRKISGWMFGALNQTIQFK